MSSAAITKHSPEEALEALIVQGNLANLTPEQRVDYYRAFCNHLDLNPVTRPFDYLNLGGKLVLYANRGCTDQLRAKRSISCRVTKRETAGDVYLVEVEARHGERVDFATGAVSVAGLKGEAHANAIMKAETKAKRRATLSICGLGIMDESEVDSVPGSRRVAAETIETVERPKLAVAPVDHSDTAHASEDDGLGGFMDPNAKPDTRPTTDNPRFLTWMKTECERVGLPAYMTVLEKAGYESAVYIVDYAEQKKVYNALCDLDATQAPPAEPGPDETAALFDKPSTKADGLATKLKGAKK